MKCPNFNTARISERKPDRGRLTVEDITAYAALPGVAEALFFIAHSKTGVPGENAEFESEALATIGRLAFTKGEPRGSHSIGGTYLLWSWYQRVRMVSTKFETSSTCHGLRQNVHCSCT